MSVIEILGQAAIQRSEANQQLAALLADGVRHLGRRIGRLLNKALSSLPGEHNLR